MRSVGKAYPGKINDIYMREKQYELHMNKLRAIQNEKPILAAKSPQKKDVVDNVKDIKRHDIDDPLLHHKNFYARKREALQIQSENERIANRIMRSDATVKKKKLDQDFNSQRKLMSRLSKHEWQQQATMKIRQNISYQTQYNKEMSVILPPVDHHEMRNSSFNQSRNNMTMTPDMLSQRNQSQTAIQSSQNNTQKNMRTKKSYSYHNGRAINISGIQKTEEEQQSLDNSQIGQSNLINKKNGQNQKKYNIQNQSSNNYQLSHSQHQNTSKTLEGNRSKENNTKETKDKAYFEQHDKSQQQTQENKSPSQQQYSSDPDQQYSQRFESPSKSIQEQPSQQITPIKNIK